MIPVISFAGALLFFGLTVLIWFLWTAVDGYEDEGGFHQLTRYEVEAVYGPLASARVWPRYFRAVYKVTMPAAIALRLGAFKSLSSNRQVILRPRGKASMDSLR